jgi:hypothetical protein
MFKQQAFSMDPMRLFQREQQLRDYHVRNWLKSTKTSKELMELCLNHFYSDQPKLLGWSLNMVDGDPKGLVIATIVRESKLNAAQAQVVYQQLEDTLQLSHRLVDEVGRNSAFNPQDAARELHARFTNDALPGQKIVIVNRPTSISVCAILLFMSVALTTVFYVGNFEGIAPLKQWLGTPGIIFGLAFTLLCGWGYWNMRRWAVLLYAIEPIARLWMGVPQPLIAIPVVIVLLGMIHFSEMSWK